MFKQIEEILVSIDNLVWGVPLIVLILLAGIFLTIRLKGLQITQLPKALKFMVKNEEGGTGEVTSFCALLYQLPLVLVISLV